VCSTCGRRILTPFKSDFSSRNKLRAHVENVAAVSQVVLPAYSNIIILITVGLFSLVMRYKESKKNKKNIIALPKSSSSSCATIIHI
jgi:hypothetical protein